jgi:hypothetical protein
MSQPDYEKALKQIETGDLSGALHSLDRILKKKSQVRTSLSPQSTSARKIPGFQRCDRRLQGSDALAADIYVIWGTGFNSVADY